MKKLLVLLGLSIISASTFAAKPWHEIVSGTTATTAAFTAGTTVALLYAIKKQPGYVPLLAASTIAAIGLTVSNYRADQRDYEHWKEAHREK